jgi:two-component system, LytTR family, response regulator
MQQHPKIALLKIGIYRLRPEKILLLAGDGNYTKIILLDGSILISTKTLSTYEEVTKVVGFVRVHKSFIINSMYLSQVTKQYVLLTNYLSPIPISRRRRRHLK